MKAPLTILSFAVLLTLATHAGTPIPITTVKRVAPLDFGRDVYPILKANCTACHNKTTTKAELNMETPASMLKGGENGPAIKPGNGADSMILQAAAHISEGAMPPKSNKVGAVDLKPEELGILKLWIDEGAKVGEARVNQIVWQALPPGLNPIYGVSITPDGEFAACSRANQISIYHVPSRQFVTKLTDDEMVKSGFAKAAGIAHRDVVQSLAFSPDGTRLASGSYREVKLWKLTAAPAVTGKSDAPPFVGPPAPPDAKLVAALKLIDKKPDRVALLDIARAQRAVGATGLEVAYQTEVSTKGDAEVKAFDERIKKAGESKAAAEKALPEKRTALKTATDAKAAAEKEAKEAAELLAKVPTDKPDAALTKRDKDAKEKLMAADKKLMEAQAAVKTPENAITDADAEVKNVTESKAKAEKTVAAAKAKLETEKLAQTNATKALADVKKAAVDNAKPAKMSAISADLKLLATAHEDGTIKLWLAETGAPVATCKPPFATFSALALKEDGALTATSNDGATWTQSMKSEWKLERSLGGGDIKSPITDRANAVRFSPDGKTLLVGSGEPSRSGDITLWEVASGKLLQDWQDRHRDSVLSLDWSPDGKLFASGGADRAMRVFDASTGKQIKAFEGHTHHVLGVAWRSDSRTIVSSGADNMIKVWDFLTGDRKKNIEGFDKEVTSILSIGASDQFVSSSGDNKVNVINSGGVVKALPGVTDFMQSAAVTRNGEVIVAGGQDSKLRIWDTESGKEIGVME